MFSEPRRTIRAKVVPIFIAMTMVSVNQFADTFWVFGLGVRPSEVMSTISSVYWLVAYIRIGVGVGATTTISFRLGRGETDRTDRLTGGGSSLALGLLLSVAASFIQLPNPIIDIVGTSEVSKLCVSYVLPMLILFSAIVLESVIWGAQSRRCGEKVHGGLVARRHPEYGYERY